MQTGSARSLIQISRPDGRSPNHYRNLNAHHNGLRLGYRQNDWRFSSAAYRRWSRYHRTASEAGPLVWEVKLPMVVAPNFIWSEAKREMVQKKTQKPIPMAAPSSAPGAAAGGAKAGGGIGSVIKSAFKVMKSFLTPAPSAGGKHSAHEEDEDMDWTMTMLMSFWAHCSQQQVKQPGLS